MKSSKILETANLKKRKNKKIDCIKVSINVEHKMQELTLCIPRISTSTTKKFIFDKLKRWKWGFIENIREYNLKEEGFKMAIIKMNFNSNEQSKLYYEKLNKGATLKVVYDNPWFWRLIKYK